jgi:hypothetical protein
MRTFALALLALCLLLLAASLAMAEKPSVCFADAEGVRRHSPESWPSWTKRMEGHKGEKCWFAGKKGTPKYEGRTEAPPIRDIAVWNGGGNDIAIGARNARKDLAIPLPRPRVAHASIQESAPVPLSEIDRPFDALMRARELSPKGRIEAGFEGVGWK